MSSKKYVVSLPEYDHVEYDEKAIRKDREELRRRMPTSVSLAPSVVEELKQLAGKKGIPYQVLMRCFILEGLERFRKSSKEKF